jgi:hypothetical protein
MKTKAILPLRLAMASVLSCVAQAMFAVTGRSMPKNTNGDGVSSAPKTALQKARLLELLRREIWVKVGDTPPSDPNAPLDGFRRKHWEKFRLLIPG